MTTLRVVVDPLITSAPGGVGRYTEELTRQLIATTPAGCDVEAIVAAHSGEKVAELRRRLPGLAGVHRVPVGRRALADAWQYGVPISVGTGMIHSPSLLAPLFGHDRIGDGDQVVVTVHNVLPFTHPESLGHREALWQRAMIKRARRHADAVVVPTHAVAEQLAERLDFGDRIRVIGGAPAESLRLPADAQSRADALHLPERYVLTMGSIEPRKGLRALIAAMALPQTAEMPLLIAGSTRVGTESALGAAAAAGLPEDRVRELGRLSDEDLAVVLDRATVFVYPSLAEGFGLPIVEAFRFGTPVIHSDDPALLEVAGGAALVVPREDAQGYPRRLADAIGRVLTDAELQHRLGVSAADRARAFSWRDSAERVWQLHADL